MATIEELARRKQKQMVRPDPGSTNQTATYHASSKPMFDLSGIMQKGMENRQRREAQQATQPKPATPAAKPDVDNLISRYTNALNNRVSQAPTQVKAPEEFEYNPYADSAYQSALRLARRNLATSQANTNARLRASGQGNSSYSETLAHQLSNNAMQRISDTVLPTYMNQAYQRYRDTVGDQFKVNQENYNRSRNQLGDMSGFLGTLQGMDQTAYNRQQDELAREAAAKQGRIDLANNLSDKYGTVVTPTLDTKLMYDQVQGLHPVEQQKEYVDNLWKVAEQAGVIPNELADMLGVPHGMSTLDAKKVAIQQQGADTASRNTDLRDQELGLRRRELRQSNTQREEQQRQEAEVSQFNSDVFTNINQLISQGATKDDVRNWLNLNASEIAKRLGPDAVDDYYNRVDSFFSPQNKSDTGLRQKAVSMAQDDTRWFNPNLTNDQKEAIIQEYMNLLQGG